MKSVEWLGTRFARFDVAERGSVSPGNSEEALSVRACRSSALSRLPCRSGLPMRCPLCCLPDGLRGVASINARSLHASSGGAGSSRRFLLRATLPCVLGAGADQRDLLARACLSCGMGIPLKGDNESCAGGAAALRSRAPVELSLLELPLIALVTRLLLGLAPAATAERTARSWAVRALVPARVAPAPGEGSRVRDSLGSNPNPTLGNPKPNVSPDPVQGRGRAARCCARRATVDGDVCAGLTALSQAAPGDPPAGVIKVYVRTFCRALSLGQDLGVP